MGRAAKERPCAGGCGKVAESLADAEARRWRRYRNSPTWGDGTRLVCEDCWERAQ